MTHTPAPSPLADRADLTASRSALLARPGFLLRRCLQKTSSAFNDACAEIGLTDRQYDYLFVLDMHERIGQTELGELVGLDRSTNALVLKILERKGLIRREIPDDDTRRRQVRITNEGRALFRQARTGADKSQEAVADGLSSKEYRQLLQLLRKVLDE